MGVGPGRMEDGPEKEEIVGLARGKGFEGWRLGGGRTGGRGLREGEVERWGLKEGYLQGPWRRET